MKSGLERNKGTFIIKIINKQNSTWQGSITWVEKQKTQNFRSALEMLKMMDEVLDGDIVIEKGDSHEENGGELQD